MNTLNLRSLRMSLFAVLLLTLLLSVQVAFAGGVDPNLPTYDSRICGREGSATSASTIRWTDVFSTGDPTTQTGNALPPSTPVTIIGRDFWGCWVSVTSSTFNGWIPVNSTDQVGILGLPVMFDNSNGCTREGAQILCPVVGGGGNAGATGSGSALAANPGSLNVVRWTNIYSAPDANSSTGVAIPQGGQVAIVSDGGDGAWVQVTSDWGNGYIPKNALP